MIKKRTFHPVNAAQSPREHVAAADRNPHHRNASTTIYVTHYTVLYTYRELMTWFKIFLLSLSLWFRFHKLLCQISSSSSYFFMQIIKIFYPCKKTKLKFYYYYFFNKKNTIFRNANWVVLESVKKKKKNNEDVFSGSQKSR